MGHLLERATAEHPGLAGTAARSDDAMTTATPVAALIVAAGLFIGWAGPGARLRAQDQGPMFRAVVDAVTIDAFAHRDRQPIVGLRATDFIVRDNGVDQRIDAMGTTDSAHIIIGVDLSGSV